MTPLGHTLNENSDAACYKSYFLIHKACFMYPDLMTLYVEICILHVDSKVFFSRGAISFVKANGISTTD